LDKIKKIHNYFDKHPGILKDELYLRYYGKKPIIHVQPKVGGASKAIINQPKVGGASKAIIIRKEKFKDNRIRNVYKIGRTFYVYYKKELIRYKDMKEKIYFT
jgi:hypothetical protein